MAKFLAIEKNIFTTYFLKNFKGQFYKLPPYVIYGRLNLSCWVCSEVFWIFCNVCWMNLLIHYIKGKIKKLPFGILFYFQLRGKNPVRWNNKRPFLKRDWKFSIATLLQNWFPYYRAGYEKFILHIDVSFCQIKKIPFSYLHTTQPKSPFALEQL